MMKIVVLLILCACATAYKYQLNLYEPAGCNYCKFAAQQIKSLILQYHWDNKLKLVVIDCEKKKHACRDSFNKPLLVLLDQKKQKISEIGGVHAKLYFRDWISGLIDKNPIKMEQIESTNKYKAIGVKNPQEVVQFYLNQTERLAKIKGDRLDILYTAFVMNSSNLTSSESGVDVAKSDDGNFRDDFRKLAVIGLPILFILGFIALIKSRDHKPRRRQYSMPVQDDQE